MADTLCRDCGGKMLPLATSLYCPKDCDRKKSKKNVASIDLDELFRRARCTKCGSDETEAFACPAGDWRCISCGHVWYL